MGRLHSAANITEQHNADDSRRAAWCTVIATAAAVVLGLMSDGVHHFDDLTHYLFARWAWQHPAYLLHDWGRPGFTVLYFIPAAAGWASCRVFSAILSGIAAWWAFRIAQRMRLGTAWLVPVLAFAQPLFFTLALTTLTETALAFYLTGSVLLALRGRWSASAAVLGIAFTTRHEAIIFLPIWFVAAWASRVSLWRLWPLPWALIVTNVLAPYANLRPSISLWLEPKPSGQYGESGWLTFLSRSMEAWGPAISALGLAGLVRTAFRPRGALVAACVCVYFVMQTAIRALGLFDSGGYPRFLVPISPLLAVSAACAWEALRSNDERERRPMVKWVAGVFVLLWLAMEVQLRRPETPAYLPQLFLAKWAVRGAAALVVLLVLVAGQRASRTVTAYLRALLILLVALAFGGMVRPLRSGPAEAVVQEAVDWLRQNGYGGRSIETAHVYADYLVGRVQPPNRLSLRRRIDAAPPGSILLWDRQFAPSTFEDLPLAEVEGNARYRPLHVGPPLPYSDEPQLRIYEKTAP